MKSVPPDRPSPHSLAKLEGNAQAAARMLKLLASEQRLLLLCRLMEGEASVGVLAEHAGAAQSSTSQHLAKMRAEGLVATRRDGQTIFYRLQNPAATHLLDALCDIYGGPAKARRITGG